MRLIPPVTALLRALLRDATAGVTTLATLSMPVVIGAAGLALDLNRGYQARMINQRVADLAALGAAMAYAENEDVTVLEPVAQDIALANGLVGADVEAGLVEDYPEEGEQAAHVEITTQMPYMLASVLGITGDFDVAVEAYAGLDGESIDVAAPCYLALSSSASAFSMSGGAVLNAPACTVAAVGGIRQMGSSLTAADVVSGSGSITVDWGDLIVNSARFAGSFSAPVWNTDVPPANKRTNLPTTLSDPWADNAERVAAISLLGTAEAIPTLSNPTTPAGSNWTFNYSPAAPLNGWWNSSTATYTVPAGNYTVNTMTVNGGIRVVFQNGSNITIRNGFTNGGTSVNFGNSNLYVNGGFNSGSSGVTIGNGDLWIGSGTVTFNGTNVKGTGNVIINSTLTIGGGTSVTMGAGNHSFGRVVIGGGGWMRLGAGNFLARTGVNIGGDSELNIASGNVNIGAHTDGHAIRIGGSGRMYMGDGTFSADGNVDTDGGSRLVIGATANHYIDGNFNIRGGVLFGKGRYTIDGNFINGTGGAVWPHTSPVTGTTYGNSLEGISTSGFDMAGVDVTFILTGTLNLAGGAKTKLFAPIASTSGGAIGELLLSSQTTAATTWGGGSNFVLSGAVHLPNSAVTMSGGSSTNSGARCFSLIASTITISGGGMTGTACESAAAAIDGLVG